MRLLESTEYANECENEETDARYRRGGWLFYSPSGLCYAGASLLTSSAFLPIPAPAADAFPTPSAIRCLPADKILSSN